MDTLQAVRGVGAAEYRIVVPRIVECDLHILIHHLVGEFFSDSSRYTGVHREVV